MSAKGATKKNLIDAVLRRVKVPDDVLPGYTKWLKGRTKAQLYQLLSALPIYK